MAKTYTEEQLNTFDKTTLIQLLLMQQSQLQEIDKKLQLLLEQAAGSITCQTPAKKYKLYKSSINKSLHFVQRSLSSSTRVHRVTAQLNLSRE